MEQTDLIHTNQETGLPATLQSDNLLVVAQEAEKRIEAINKIKSIALRVTNELDWRDEGGKPYLQVSGAEKVARVFGISWTLETPLKTTDPEGHFVFATKGNFSMGGGGIDFIGTRRSRDPFFLKRKDKPDRLPSEINEMNVMKASITNCLGNGITRLLGIRNLTWDEVKLGGVDRSKVVKTEYKKPPQAQKTAQEAQSGPGQGSSMPTPPNGHSSWYAALQNHLAMNYLDLDEAARALKQATAFDNFPGYTNIEGIQKAVKPELIAKIAYEKLVKT